MQSTYLKLYRLLPLLLLALLLAAGCSEFKKSKMEANGLAEWSDPEPAQPAEVVEEAELEGTEVSVEDDIEPLDLSKYTIVKGPRHLDRIRINPIGDLSEVFNDSNKYQYEHAERLGISPLENLGLAYATRRPIVRIEPNEYYAVAKLDHSLPYLVPEAARLLKLIGRNFIDSLASRGADGYRIMVTSVLRTPHLVRKLRRVNRNAVDSSTHKFATTFDISYATFACRDTTRTINGEDLKNLLAEVLWDLRRQNRCMVKYERKSPCFHITVTQ